MKNAILCLSLAMLGAETSASPVYYSFQGTVSGISDPGRSMFHPEDSIRYVFLVDEDMPGIVLHHTVPYPLAGDPVAGIRYYYAEFISGTVEGVPVPEYGDKSYFGMEQTGSAAVTTTLRGSEDLVDGISFPDLRRNQVSITAKCPLDSWFVGQTGFQGENLFPAGDGSRVSIRSDLALTEIYRAPIPSVPEPTPFGSLLAGSALLLAGAGIGRARGEMKRAAAGYRLRP
jgi:hypothetical protein